jgi:hypothetical protein
VPSRNNRASRSPEETVARYRLTAAVGIARQAGRELGVRYVLEGSVRRMANCVRVTGQLVEAETGRHIWADRYDRTLDDVFALQDELTMNVVAAIEPSLRQAEIERVKRKRPENLDAYDLVLRAIPHVYPEMPDGAAILLAATHAKLGRLDAAKAAAKRVLELQPGFTISGTCTAFDMHPSIAVPLSEALSLAGLPA